MDREQVMSRFVVLGMTLLLAVAYVLTWSSVRDSMGQLRENDRRLAEGIDAVSRRLDEFGSRWVAGRSAVGIPATPDADAVRAPKPEPEGDTVAVTPARHGQEPSEWPFLGEADLPEQFQGRFGPRELFLDVGDGGVARLAFPSGFDPYSNAEARKLSEDLLLAYLDMHDMRAAEIARRLDSRDYSCFADFDSASDKLTTLKASGRKAAIRELPTGEFAVLDLTEESDPSRSVRVRDRVLELCNALKRFEADTPYFAVYESDFQFRDP
ncbi:MAG: hypothetical protein KDC38_12910 [Planctomycetes bacterium]|nr:hypothetical protein [Planctomycetota bacterium]